MVLKMTHRQDAKNAKSPVVSRIDSASAENGVHHVPASRMKFRRRYAPREAISGSNEKKVGVCFSWRLGGEIFLSESNSVSAGGARA